MADSPNSKPGSRPGATTLAAPKPAAEQPSASAGRIVHDERGNAVWDWLKDTARIAIDSTSRLLRRLEVPDLKVEDTQEKDFRLESGRDSSGGYDPYAGGGAGSAKSRRAPDPGRALSGKDGRSPFDPGGGYDPYGRGVTRKP
jgi:hypothetical protein